MHPTYPNMFSPLKLGPIEVPNRFYFSPHGLPLTVGNEPSADFVSYNVERVKGGTGLIVASVVAHPRGASFQPSPWPEQHNASFRAAADAIHEAGGKFFGELWYWWGSNGRWQPFGPPGPSLSASVAQFGHGEGNDDRIMSTHALSKADVRAMIAAFVRSARNMREGGFDGIMLHAAHAAIFEHFISPYYNRRTDEYGGSLQNRLRFLTETIEDCREATRGEMAIGIRFNADEMLPGGYDAEGAREILEALCSSGLLDFVDLDVAIEPNQTAIGMPPAFIEPHFYRPFVEKVRGAAGDVPVMSVLGRLTSIADGEAAIAAGVCDMVGATRGLMAEPELVANARDGREERSRICIACNWCMTAHAEGALGCAINPATYRERQWGAGSFTSAANRTRVVIVGGGPGGLEAARVCALRGHDVTLYEARNRLGGAFALWAALPGRDGYFRAIEWWEAELERLGVRVELGHEACADTVLAGRPNAVIIATGALFARDGRSPYLDTAISGHDRDFVLTPEDILHHGKRPHGKVVIADGEGHHAGLGLAEMLAGDGCSVHYLTPRLSPVASRLMFGLEGWLVMKRLRKAGVAIFNPAWIDAIGERSVTVLDMLSDELHQIDEVDAVVLCTGRLPQDGLARELEGKVDQLFTIGDALAVRPWAAASYEGQKFARYIGEPGAPSTFGEAWFRPDGPEVMPLPAATRETVDLGDGRSSTQ